MANGAALGRLVITVLRPHLAICRTSPGRRGHSARGGRVRVRGARALWLGGSYRLLLPPPLMVQGPVFTRIVPLAPDADEVAGLPAKDGSEIAINLAEARKSLLCGNCLTHCLDFID